MLSPSLSNDEEGIADAMSSKLPVWEMVFRDLPNEEGSE
jgi:hypothetical protein